MNEKLERERKRLHTDKSDIIRQALDYYLTKEERQQTMQTMLGCFEQIRLSLEVMTYELVRTRAVLLLRADMMHRELSEKERHELLEEGGKDARVYLEEKKNGQGTRAE